MKSISWILSLLVLSGITACNSTSVKDQYSYTDKVNKKDLLYVYADGSMKFKDRLVHRDDVVIYEDGFGGEKAAIKMDVPLHPDYYRDSIHVVRTESGSDNNR